MNPLDPNFIENGLKAGTQESMDYLEFLVTKECDPGEHDLDRSGFCRNCAFSHTEAETYYERFGEDQQ